MLLASVRTSIVVGTILTLINQWGIWRTHTLGLQFVARVGFNYLVPFLVAAYSQAALTRDLVAEGVGS
ncbi:MAG: hypothetical protein KGN74_12090 [Gemmatimonadota bacterium]|nr:hypothetical protein [Gemmatimonadota bacterium]